MVATIGLSGLRPDPARVSEIASPPYDVIKPGTPLENLLSKQANSLFHIILGDDPASARDRMLDNGSLIEDPEPAYYVYEQTWDGGQRTGVFAAGDNVHGPDLVITAISAAHTAAQNIHRYLTGEPVDWVTPAEEK